MHGLATACSVGSINSRIHMACIFARAACCADSSIMVYLILSGCSGTNFSACEIVYWVSLDDRLSVI